MDPTSSTRKTRRRLLGLALSLALLAAFDQLLLYTVLSDGALLGHELAPFAPPLYGPRQRAMLEEYEDLLVNHRESFDRQTQFDAYLGWCPRPGYVSQLATFDWAGSRVAHEPLPREVPAETRLVALVGCSFTHGSEVEGHQTWAAQLERLTEGTLLGNFGVAGHGIDQALLRYRRDVAGLDPDEVWLGFFPGAALRPTTQFPPLLGRWRTSTLFFKPCFTLGEDDSLIPHPSPARVPEDIPRLLRDPLAFLAGVEGADRWIARVRPAHLPLGSHWTHKTALGRLALTFYERGGRDTQALLADRESEVFAINRTIVLALRDEVERSGARFRLLLLPGELDLRGLSGNDRPYWKSWTEELELQGVEVLDVTSELLRAGVEPGAEFWMPEGHYTPHSNRLVAEAITSGWFSG
jgi:hypothetical protein